MAVTEPPPAPRAPRREAGNQCEKGRPPPDPTAFVEHEAAYRATLRGAGRESHLVQTFTTETEHSALSDSEYANSLSTLDTWARTDNKPTPHSIARSCAAFDERYGSGCFNTPDFLPEPYAARIRPRPGGLSW